jgi:hypothetical protein
LQETACTSKGTQRNQLTASADKHAAASILASTNDCLQVYLLATRFASSQSGLLAHLGVLCSCPCPEQVDLSKLAKAAKQQLHLARKSSGRHLGKEELPKQMSQAAGKKRAKSQHSATYCNNWQL